MLNAFEDFRDFGETLLEPIFTVATEVVKSNNSQVRLVVAVNQAEIINFFDVVLLDVVVEQFCLEVHHFTDLRNSRGKFVEFEQKKDMVFIKNVG